MTLRKSKITKHSSLKTQQTTIKFKQPSLQDARHPIHRVRILYSKFSSPKTCHNVHENSLKIGHTRVTRFVSFSNVRDARGPLIRMRAWSSRNCMTSQTCKRRKHALTFLVFRSVKFFESLYASWYRCLLHNIIFWQNLSKDFFFLIKNMKLYDF